MLPCNISAFTLAVRIGEPNFYRSQGCSSLGDQFTRHMISSNFLPLFFFFFGCDNLSFLFSGFYDISFTGLVSENFLHSSSPEPHLILASRGAAPFCRSEVGPTTAFMFCIMSWIDVYQPSLPGELATNISGLNIWCNVPLSEIFLNEHRHFKTFFFTWHLLYSLIYFSSDIQSIPADNYHSNILPSARNKTYL